MTGKINANNFPKTDIKAGTIKSDIPDHFLVFLISKTTRTGKHSTETFIKWQNINSETPQEFKEISQIDRNFVRC